MPQKIFTIAGVGDVTVVKRRRSKNLRISISPAGNVRVSIPQWTPYITGVRFAKSRADWINQHLENVGVTALFDGCLIGKRHELKFTNTVGRRESICTRVSNNVILVSTNLPWNSTEVQQSALKACERSLRDEAKQALPKRVATLASLYGFHYSDVKISKLSSRWGSCSSRGVLTLSYFLIQLPQEMIDYVILHELVHTQHMHHGKIFWDTLSKILPDARQMKKSIHNYKPRVEPITTVAID